MEFNRNQYFMAGLVVLLIGIQIRLVDSYVLNERATQFLAQRMQQIKGQQASAGDASTFMGSSALPAAKHRLRRPKWMGYSTISIGGVLVLYSLALKKPGG
jgi:hypothetical protein